MCAQTTQDLVEALTNTFCADPVDIRQRHIFEQSLHALVRLAKAEQMVEIKASVKKLTTPVAIKPGMRQT